MPEGAGGRFGGLNSQLELLEREYLKAKGVFNEHTVYVLGKPLVVPETCQITIAVSTENLLLNAYRQVLPLVWNLTSNRTPLTLWPQMSVVVSIGGGLGFWRSGNF